MRTSFLACLATLTFLACSNDETSSTGTTGSSSKSTTTSSNTVGSGGSGGTGTGGTGGGTGGGCPTSADPMELTSTAVMEMGLLPAQYKCGGPQGFPGGMNISPPLAWTAGPAGTLSYAVFFRDLTSGVFNHSAIWDVPACTLELPEAVENTTNPAEVPGAKQCHSYSNGPFGYAGPCAPGFPSPRTYQFEVYAIDVATIPELMPDTSSLAEVQTALDSHSLGSDTLTVIEDGGDP